MGKMTGICRGTTQGSKTTVLTAYLVGMMNESSSVGVGHCVLQALIRPAIEHVVEHSNILDVLVTDMAFVGGIPVVGDAVTMPLNSDAPIQFTLPNGVLFLITMKTK